MGWAGPAPAARRPEVIEATDPTRQLRRIRGEELTPSTPTRRPRRPGSGQRQQPVPKARDGIVVIHHVLTDCTESSRRHLMGRRPDMHLARRTAPERLHLEAGNPCPRPTGCCSRPGPGWIRLRPDVRAATGAALRAPARQAPAPTAEQGTCRAPSWTTRPPHASPGPRPTLCGVGPDTAAARCRSPPGITRPPALPCRVRRPGAGQPVGALSAARPPVHRRNCGGNRQANAALHLLAAGPHGPPHQPTKDDRSLGAPPRAVEADHRRPAVLRSP